MAMNSDNKKSPLKAAPLRNPGQSLDEEIDTLWNESAQYYILFVAGFFGMVVIDWLRWLTARPLNPLATTIVFMVVLAFSTYKLREIRKKSHQLKLARDGEKAVGQYLDLLREKGTRILHDIRGDTFNIDHVVISTKGIFVVDTKTYRKPVNGNAIVRVKNEEVYVNNYLVERNPIKQSRALCKWIQVVLEESTGKKFHVQGVVVFPGWFVEKEPAKIDIWVLNPKALPAFIDNCPEKLSIEDVRLAHFHLSRYIRSNS